ncbi:DUF4214 domain-containing protein [Pseudoduganella buxea]|uniref:DUF4214 domain-containing protein n=1 Tax=Pseudoduganella buxea TaxID=1949069 RepID=A0A6I3SVV3_9BURK|nr:DUF4214 domain-containing protein [Pseudoduganella buxea]MTV53381.1 DUF4214 domain-containing protein [Pseudoduganella buxea]GGC07146.1 hemolysin-type calcium-binding region [Pseudoduganella buxea]
MASAQTINAVQQLYIAFFNRPAEPTGLKFWTDAVEAGGSLAGVSAAFARDTEYQAQFANLGPDQIIAKIYDNLFNRLPDPSGLDFWSGKLQSGELTISNIVDTIANSAVNNPTVSPTDTAAITNKVKAAVQFTNLLNNDVALRLAYGNPQAGEIAKAYIHSVTDEASYNLAVADLPTTTAEAILMAGQPVGGTQTLTIGQDVLVGTSANDTFNTFVVKATDGTISNVLASYDSIDGGAGNDTLNLNVDTGINDSLVGTVKGVENINITGSDKLDAGTTAADFFAGSTKITVDGAATTVTGVTAQKVVFNAGEAAVANGVTYDAAATAGTIGLSNTSGTITVGGAKLATLSVEGSTHATAGAADVLTLVDSTATSTITKLNVAVTTGTELDITDLDKLTAIDASASKAGIKIVGNGTTVATIATGVGYDTVTLNTATTSTKAASLTTGAGNDTITVATTGAGNVTVNAGSGDDTISMAAADLTAKFKVDGGEGADTLNLTSGGTIALTEGNYVLFDAAISNIETLAFGAAVTAADGSRLDQFTSLEFDAAGVITKVQANQALTAHDNITATAAGYANPASGATTYAGSLNVTTDAAAGAVVLNADSATVNVVTDLAAAAATISGDLKTSLTVNVTNGPDSASSPTADVLASADITIGAVDTGLLALTAVTLAGNGSVTVDSSAADAKLASVDASALTGTLAFGANAGNITGGLTYTGNAALAETIKLGAGHDMLTLASTYEAMDTITGLDVTKESADAKSTTDVLEIGGVTIDGATASTDVVKLTLGSGDTSLALAFANAGANTAAGKIAQFVFEGNTYLFADDGATVGSLDATDFAVKLVGTVDLTTAFGVAAA